MPLVAPGIKCRKMGRVCVPMFVCAGVVSMPVCVCGGGALHQGEVGARLHTFILEVQTHFVNKR